MADRRILYIVIVLGGNRFCVSTSVICVDKPAMLSYTPPHEPPDSLSVSQTTYKEDV
jgi:hypothetical protein